MQIKSLFLVLVLALVSMAGTSHARKATDADKKMVRSVMKYLGDIAEILGTNPKDAKKTLDRLEVYVDENGPEMRKIITKMAALQKELDVEAKKELSAYAEQQPEIKKLQENAIAFAMAHQKDQAVMERFGRIMMKLDPGSSAGDAPAAKQKPAKN
ncbi:MAG TPA: hypothetical protein VML75_04255 [Kofleriaceae bacterium]|nr:hypothetical protein [Kofleriaceae bacterium]